MLSRRDRTAAFASGAPGASPWPRRPYSPHRGKSWRWNGALAAVSLLTLALVRVTRQSSPNDLLGEAYTGPPEPEERAGLAHVDSKEVEDEALVSSYDAWKSPWNPSKATTRPPTNSMWVHPMPRIKHGELSLHEFYERFRDRPVIVEGAVRDQPLTGMSFQDISRQCTKGGVRTAVYGGAGAKEWAGLVDRRYMMLSDYIDEHILGASSGQVANGTMRYGVGGVSFFYLCAAFDYLTKVPMYVSDQCAQYEQLGKDCDRGPGQCTVMYHQPETFIGPAGTKTEIHVDSPLIPFYMSVHKGKKRFRVIRYEDAFAFDLFRQSQDRIRRRVRGVVKQLAVWDPDFEVFPELSQVPVYEGVVGEGDFIFLPAGSFHAVQNEQASLGISSNVYLPGAVEHFLDACMDFQYDENCALYVEGLARANEIYIPGCEDLRLKKPNRARLKHCLLSTKPMRAAMRGYGKGGSGELPLHKLWGFASHTEWCKTNCMMATDDEHNPNHDRNDFPRESFDARRLCSQCPSGGVNGGGNVMNG